MVENQATEDEQEHRGKSGDEIARVILHLLPGLLVPDHDGGRRK
jgi:hypothetical protein